MANQPLLRNAKKATEFREITQNSGHYAVQGHRFWCQSKGHIRLPISDNTNLHRFQVKTDYWSNFRYH